MFLFSFLMAEIRLLEEAIKERKLRELERRRKKTEKGRWEERKEENKEASKTSRKRKKDGQVEEYDPAEILD